MRRKWIIALMLAGTLTMGTCAAAAETTTESTEITETAETTGTETAEEAGETASTETAGGAGETASTETAGGAGETASTEAAGGAGETISTETSEGDGSAQTEYTEGNAVDITKEELVENVKAAVEDVNSLSMDATLDTTLAMSMSGEESESGMELTMGINMALSAEAVEEPYGSHIQMTLGMDLLGQVMEQTMETYSVEEDGRKVTYTQTTENGTASGWTRDDVDDEMTDTLNGLQILEDQEWYNQAEQYTLQDNKVVDGEGREYYVLEGDLDLSEGSELGDELKSLLDSLEESMGSGAIEFPDVIGLDLYIYADQMLPARLTMDMSGIQGAIPTEGSDVPMNMEFRTLVMDLSLGDYNAIDAIEVPQEALDSANSSETETGSGTEAVVGTEDTETEVSTTGTETEYTEPQFILTTDTSVEFTQNGTAPEVAASLGEMGKAYYYNVNSGNYEQVGVKLTGFSRGEEAAALVDQLLNEEGSYYSFAALRDNEEYCLVNYDMYFPQDMTDSQYGVYVSGCQLDVVGQNGDYLESDGQTYFPYVYDVYDESGKVYHPGDTGSFQAIVILPKDAEGFCFQFGPYDSEYFYAEPEGAVA